MIKVESRNANLFLIAVITAVRIYILEKLKWTNIDMLFEFNIDNDKKQWKIYFVTYRYNVT